MQHDDSEEINDCQLSAEELERFYATTEREAEKKQEAKAVADADATSSVTSVQLLRQHIQQDLNKLKLITTDDKQIAQLSPKERKHLFTDFCSWVITSFRSSEFIFLINQDTALTQILRYNPPPSPHSAPQLSPAFSLSPPSSLSSFIPSFTSSQPVSYYEQALNLLLYLAMADDDEPTIMALVTAHPQIVALQVNGQSLDFRKQISDEWDKFSAEQLVSFYPARAPFHKKFQYSSIENILLRKGKFELLLKITKCLPATGAGLNQKEFLKLMHAALHRIAPGQKETLYHKLWKVYRKNTKFLFFCDVIQERLELLLPPISDHTRIQLALRSIDPDELTLALRESTTESPFLTFTAEQKQTAPLFLLTHILKQSTISVAAIPQQITTYMRLFAILLGNGPHFTKAVASKHKDDEYFTQLDFSEEFFNRLSDLYEDAYRQRVLPMIAAYITNALLHHAFIHHDKQLLSRVLRSLVLKVPRDSITLGLSYHTYYYIEIRFSEYDPLYAAMHTFNKDSQDAKQAPASSLPVVPAVTLQLVHEFLEYYFDYLCNYPPLPPSQEITRIENELADYRKRFTPKLPQEFASIFHFEILQRALPLLKSENGIQEKIIYHISHLTAQHKKEFLNLFIKKNWHPTRGELFPDEIKASPSALAQWDRLIAIYHTFQLTTDTWASFHSCLVEHHRKNSEFIIEMLLDKMFLNIIKDQQNYPAATLNFTNGEGLYSQLYLQVHGETLLIGLLNKFLRTGKLRPPYPVPVSGSTQANELLALLTTIVRQVALITSHQSTTERIAQIADLQTVIAQIDQHPTLKDHSSFAGFRTLLVSELLPQHTKSAQAAGINVEKELTAAKMAQEMKREAKRPSASDRGTPEKAKSLASASGNGSDSGSDVEQEHSPKSHRNLEAKEPEKDEDEDDEDMKVEQEPQPQGMLPRSRMFDLSRKKHAEGGLPRTRTFDIERGQQLGGLDGSTFISPLERSSTFTSLSSLSLADNHFSIAGHSPPKPSAARGSAPTLALPPTSTPRKSIVSNFSLRLNFNSTPTPTPDRGRSTTSGSTTSNPTSSGATSSSSLGSLNSTSRTSSK